MSDFSQNYFNLKRTVLIFAALTLLFCAPGANVTGLNIAGIALGGVSFELLLFFVAAAAIYYGILFAMTAFVDAKYSLLSLERNEADLKAVLEKALGAVTGSIRTLTSTMERAVSLSENESISQKIQQIDALIAQEKVTLNSGSVFYRHEIEHSALFNVLSHHILRAEKVVPASKQLKMHELKDLVLDALKADLPRLVHKSVVESAGAGWSALRQSIETASALTNENVAAVLGEMRSHAERLNVERQVISNALLQVGVLKSVRSARFWIMEVGVVGVLLVTAIAHYLGRFMVIFPTPFGAF